MPRRRLQGASAFQLLGWRPNPKLAVLNFGFFHGFGLATKLQEFAQAQQHIGPKFIAFNVGVELGQLLALMTVGFVLMGYQLTGYLI